MPVNVKHFFPATAGDRRIPRFRIFVNLLIFGIQHRRWRCRFKRRMKLNIALIFQPFNSEARISKSETNSKFKFSNVQNAFFSKCSCLLFGSFVFLAFVLRVSYIQ